ncbi:helix-turn-helix domain-containing protein [Salmonella enterica]|uniref:Helix-turn-helix domain-containing protein n=1 Tax=Salmonella enterica TaxID=28901 RepID=A0A5U1J6Y0_SALER|nr:helix-turn-helix domain-containing protein [Salmonella enterica]EBO7332131.1 helix-turn-helix domain-containing protein [Salmonella enterica]EDB0771446.1 helix-turn-helix domain-containing protein [Salmonella enterica]EDL7724753.1 transcriptional regulator [Salmonella enterica subsp. enterica serovar Give]EHD9191580.1 helix-turn-helix domain-containing protein [Salmonella enterica]
MIMGIERADIAIRFTEERAKSGYSQRDLANQLGVSVETVRRYEAGLSRIDAEFLAKAAGFGMDVQYILVGIRTNNIKEVEKATAPLRDAPETPPVVSINSSSNVIGVAQTGATINQISNINPVTKTIAKVEPGKEHITDEQAARLQALVKTVVETEARIKREPKSFRAVWGALNSHCKASSYRLIPLTSYEKAEKYLLNWVGRLNSSASAPKKDNAAWRNRRYAYIKINTKDDISALRLKNTLQRKYNVSSISELTDEDLDKVYRSIASSRTRSKK